MFVEKDTENFEETSMKFPNVLAASHTPNYIIQILFLVKKIRATMCAPVDFL